MTVVVTEASPVLSSRPSVLTTDVVLYTCTKSVLQAACYGPTYCAGNEVGIFAVCGVPITSVENADGVFVDGWEGLEEADEAVLVVDLVTY